MNLVDSSGWLEYFADGAHADFFAPSIKDTNNLIVSTINLYEVFKKVLLQSNEAEALKVIATMQQGHVVAVTNPIALSAAKISLEQKLPMADSIILATARANKAILWTQDNHFENIEGVKYIKRG